MQYYPYKKTYIYTSSDSNHLKEMHHSRNILLGSMFQCWIGIFIRTSYSATNGASRNNVFDTCCFVIWPDEDANSALKQIASPIQLTNLKLSFLREPVTTFFTNTDCDRFP
ncbi:hypothetical protein GDO81_026664 [Engystomops pustulosus]|uniref:Uncharacterized protein n=1 Tax=Engystomops pustulosus TaxID=76066 RepID=A0AAV6YYW0_ENGPU|nr:hypothetical protein GDO81_026664 [Engystomops pustulosus]